MYLIAKFLRSRRWLACVAFVFAGGAALFGAEVPRERISFNRDWRFIKGDPGWLPGQLDYTVLREWLLPSGADFLGATARKPTRPPGNIWGGLSYAQSDFKDDAWRSLDVPHDWGVDGAFQQELDGNTGKLPWAGIAWYRKKFNVPAEDAGRRVSLEIDGAMARPVVWLNGQLVGGWPYGYSSFALDLTPYLKPGAENVLAIRLDNVGESSRWYPGGGLYRNVWLTKTGAVHVAHWGTVVATPRVTADSAMVTVATQTDNETDVPANVRLVTELFELDANGKKSAAPIATSKPTSVKIGGRKQASVMHTLEVKQPKLWSVRTPQRYVAVTTVTQAEQAVDVYETPFGIRSVAFDAARGFLLNGELLRIQGVCNHHDLGALGTAVNSRALERQLEILREMGCNAIRTSHNPPAPELLELCDRMGLLVFDEPFDCWVKGKNRHDYHELFADWHEQDLRALVRRDRNHPSVVMWSIGNEVLEQWGEDGQEGWKLSAHLAAIVREEDRTRPVSAAFNGEQCGYNGHQVVLDATGYNYRVGEYARYRATNPTVPLFGAETASAISSRGEYFFPVSDHKLTGRVNFQVSSYDLSAADWASIPDVEWRAADNAPGYAGEFVWTGFDYLGEPTPYGSDATTQLNFSDPDQRAKAAKQLEAMGKIPVPSRSSYFGIIDLAGFPKDRYYLYQSRWRAEFPMAHILPHWTWPERVGEVTPVHVYTSGDEAELFLNGRSLGRKKKAAQEYRLRWDDVVYAPGELKVVAYKNGAPWADATQKTAGAATALELKADRSSLAADGSDLAFVTARVVDDTGTLVPRAKNRVHFSVRGPAEIVATDNGDPTDLQAFRSAERRVFNGLGLVIVRPRRGETGAITLRAEADGLRPVEISLTIERP
jgi:beta-galactosidase